MNVETKLFDGVQYSRLPGNVRIEGTPPTRSFKIEGVAASPALHGSKVYACFAGKYFQTIDGEEVERSASIIKPVWVTVAAVTIANPVDTNNDGLTNDPAVSSESFVGNEFTFSADEPEGLLQIPIRVDVEPDVEAIRGLVAGMTSEITSIGDSHSGGAITTFQWTNAQSATVGRPTYTSAEGLWVTEADFLGLPELNDDFGRKTVTIGVSGPSGFTMTLKRDIEVFYPRDATNHPGGDQTPPVDQQDAATAALPNLIQGRSHRCPNSFYYWNQSPAGDSRLLYHSEIHPTALGGMVPAMKCWSHPLVFPKDAAWIGDAPVLISNFQTRGGSPELVTGIDFFANIVRHEFRHISQITEHDALMADQMQIPGSAWVSGWEFHRLPTPPGDGFTNWLFGPDGKPGVANFDDDVPPDGLIDETLDLSEIGYGDDIDLDTNDNVIADSLPYDLNGLLEAIEKDAQQQESIPQNAFADFDWG